MRRIRWNPTAVIDYKLPCFTGFLIQTKLNFYVFGTTIKISKI